MEGELAPCSSAAMLACILGVLRDSHWCAAIKCPPEPLWAVPISVEVSSEWPVGIAWLHWLPWLLLPQAVPVSTCVHALEVPHGCCVRPFPSCTHDPMRWALPPCTYICTSAHICPHLCICTFCVRLLPIAAICSSAHLLICPSAHLLICCFLLLLQVALGEYRDVEVETSSGEDEGGRFFRVAFTEAAGGAGPQVGAGVATGCWQCDWVLGMQLYGQVGAGNATVRWGCDWALGILGAGNALRMRGMQLGAGNVVRWASGCCQCNWEGQRGQQHQVVVACAPGMCACWQLRALLPLPACLLPRWRRCRAAAAGASSSGGPSRGTICSGRWRQHRSAAGSSQTTCELPAESDSRCLPLQLRCIGCAGCGVAAELPACDHLAACPVYGFPARCSVLPRACPAGTRSWSTRCCSTLPSSTRTPGRSWASYCRWALAAWEA